MVQTTPISQATGSDNRNSASAAFPDPHVIKKTMPTPMLGRTTRLKAVVGDLKWSINNMDL
jgi:hypothetical protein